MLILPPGNRLATISYFSINLFLEKSPLKEPEKISLKTHCFDFSPPPQPFCFLTRAHILAPKGLIRQPILWIHSTRHSGYCCGDEISFQAFVFSWTLNATKKQSFEQSFKTMHMFILDDWNESSVWVHLDTKRSQTNQLIKVARLIWNRYRLSRTIRLQTKFTFWMMTWMRHWHTDNSS